MMSEPREFCPKCEPEYVPSRYDTPWTCGHHIPFERTPDDLRVIAETGSEFYAMACEGGGEGNRLICDFIHRRIQ